VKPLDITNNICGIDDSVMPYIGKTMKFADMCICSEMTKQGYNLSRTQIVMLKVLHQQGALPQNDLAFLTERDKTSLTRLINTLEKKNLVARISSPDDKRVNMIHLTTNGEKLFAEVRPLMKEIIGEMQNGLSEDDKETVKKAMLIIQENCIKKLQ
jgi:DNA-binding MarR family transcriptional regulator